eukprot:18017-Heterococcus_DN1.PRE.1
MTSAVEAALLSAAATGDLAEVERTIAEGAPIEGRNKALAGSTALIAATEGGHADVVTRLIELGANVNAVNRMGEPPLSIAVSRGDEDIARALLAHGASVDANDREWRTPLLKAVKNCNGHMVELLLDAGADADIADIARPHSALGSPRPGHSTATCCCYCC